MNVLPLAPPDSAFSDAIVCRFRLRPLTIAGVGPATAFPFAGEDQELVFSCNFEAPRQDGAGMAPVQDGWCVTPSGETARFRVHDEQGGRQRRPARLRRPALGPVLHRPAGPRSSRKRPDGSPSRRSGPKCDRPRDRNVLSIVVEADCRPWLRNGRGPLFAVVGETVVAGKLPIRIERFGRPEIKNVIMAMKEFDQVNRDLEIRDLYNLEDAFHMSKDYGGAYRARLNANLALHRSPRRQDRLAARPGWRPPADRAAARRLPGGRRLEAVRRRQLLRDRAGDPRTDAPTKRAAAGR